MCPQTAQGVVSDRFNCLHTSFDSHRNSFQWAHVGWSYVELTFCWIDFLLNCLSVELTLCWITFCWVDVLLSWRLLSWRCWEEVRRKNYYWRSGYFADTLGWDILDYKARLLPTDCGRTSSELNSGCVWHHTYSASSGQKSNHHWLN